MEFELAYGNTLKLISRALFWPLAGYIACWCLLWVKEGARSSHQCSDLDAIAARPARRPINRQRAIFQGSGCPRQPHV